MSGTCTKSPEHYYSLEKFDGAVSTEGEQCGIPCPHAARRDTPASTLIHAIVTVCTRWIRRTASVADICGTEVVLLIKPLDSGVRSRLYDFVMPTNQHVDTATKQIGEIAERTALTVDAIRFYEKRKLLPKAIRSAGRFRLLSSNAGLRAQNSLPEHLIPA